MKIECNNCEYCKALRRSQSQCGRIGKKHFFCTHKKVLELPNESFGNKMREFIGFSQDRFYDRVNIKTSPRWCPRKGEK